MDKSILDEWKHLSDKVDEVEDKIVSRIQEVLILICDHYGASYETFYFYDAQEGQVGNLSCGLMYGNDQVTYTLESKSSCKLMETDWDYTSSFPIEFLFMTNEEIKHKLTVGD